MRRRIFSSLAVVIFMLTAIAPAAAEPSDVAAASVQAEPSLTIYVSDSESKTDKAYDNAISIVGPGGSVYPGERIKIIVDGSADAGIMGISGDVRTEGLQFVSASSGFSDANGIVLLPSFGASTCIYTYTVHEDAKRVSFEVSNTKLLLDDDSEVVGPSVSWATTVSGEAPPSNGEITFTVSPPALLSGNSVTLPESGTTVITAYPTDGNWVIPSTGRGGISTDDDTVIIRGILLDAGSYELTYTIPNGTKKSLTVVQPLPEGPQPPADSSYSFVYAPSSHPGAFVIEDYTGTIPAKLEIPSEVVSIGRDDKSTTVLYPAFGNGNGEREACLTLKEVVIPKGICIGYYSFSGCSNLTTINLQDAGSLVGGAFDGCSSLNNVVLPSVPVLPFYFFRNCTGLRDVSIPQGVRSLGEGAFEGCTGLMELMIPSSVDSIVGDAFKNCRNLKKITYGGTRADWIAAYSPDQDSRLPADTTIYCSDGVLSDNELQPSVRPAPVIPEITGYESGRINGRNYYVKTAGALTMYYLQSLSGRMVRVSAPYTTAADGSRFYPVNYGGAALFPRLEDGSISCYCLFAEGLETPVLKAVSAPKPVYTDGYQTGRINGRDYYIKTSGASLMFYLKSRSGRMVRVSAPYVKAADGTRYYPVNHGGTVLFPKLSGEGLASYETGSGQTVLTVI